MSRAFDIEKYLGRRREQIERALDKVVPAGKNDGGISAAMRYSLIGGGKRLRPILCLAAAETFGKPAAHFVQFACGIECIHTYSLIHDDLPAMDNDDMRRGKPTLHVAFSDAVAILAGDGLLTLAFELMAGRGLKGAEAARRLEALSVVSRAAGFRGMVLGQALDIYYEDREIAPAMLKTLHTNKTAALIEASVVSGSILGQAPSHTLKPMKQFGRSLGLAFQIVDDLLDATGDEELVGKQLGKDGSKATYPSLFGVEGARLLARRETDAALNSLKRVKQDTSVLRAIAEYALNRSY